MVLPFLVPSLFPPPSSLLPPPLLVGSTWKALPYVMKEGIYSIALPNPMNFAFDFSIYLKLHLILIPLGEFGHMCYLCESQTISEVC